MRLRWLVLGLLVTVLLVPAALLTLARVLQPPGGAWVRMVAFAPYAAVLYAVALVLLLLACLGARRRWRALPRVLAVLALVGAGLHVWWASGPFVGSPAAAAEGTPTLRVMTSNLRLGLADPSRLLTVVLDGHVDVLVLEEVSPPALAGLREAGLDRVLPHAVGAPGPGVDGTMVFAAAPLTGASRLGTPFGGYRVDVRLPGGPVHLLAVHPRPPTGEIAGWRRDHAVVRRAALALRGPSMVVGDLNATTDHRPVRALAAAGYVDAATAARSGWQPTWPADGVVSRFGVRLPSLFALDHVLLRGGPRAVRTASVTVDGSDHRALLAVLAL